jgi:HAD superfamily hydrolase (TIGR01509 family)
MLFDMDGTLTVPMLDFPRIKAEMGIGNRPILETLATLTAASRKTAEAILHRHEIEAAYGSALNEGCLEVLDWCRFHHIRTAVITRNSRICCDVVMHRHQLAFDQLITRDDGVFKPDPAPLFLACQRLGVQPQQSWMIGDSTHDVQAGIAANITSVWISHNEAKKFPEKPTYAFPSLFLMLEFLTREFPLKVSES